MCTQPNAATTRHALASEDSVITFMREMREQFGSFEYKAVSPRGTILVSKGWHRVRPEPSKVFPWFDRDPNPTRGAA